jgi:iron complex outermembrane receptor protein
MKTSKLIAMLGAALSVLVGPELRSAETVGFGSVTGRVTNAATGESLPGASVRVDGTSVVTTSEPGGGYALSLPPGDYTLVVTYSGLDSARVPVSVGRGGAVKDVALTSSIYVLDAVAVEGVREGNARAIQLQRSAINPKTIVATDAFGQPAANPGELIQRLPGIATDIVGSEVRTLYIRGMGNDFSSLMVDGDRIATSNGSNASRQYQIEQYGTGNLETIEVIKAPTADQDANAIAGFVNLVSRRAFDRTTRRLEISAGTTWRRPHTSIDPPMKDRPDNLDLFNVMYEDAFRLFGEEKNFGVSFNFNRRVSSTIQDEVGPQRHFGNLSQQYLNHTGVVNAANPQGKILQRGFGMAAFYYPAVAQNIGLSADFKFSPRALAFVKFQYNTNDQSQRIIAPGFGNAAATLADFTPDSTYEFSHLRQSAANRAITRSHTLDKVSTIYSVTGGTEFKLFDDSAKLTLRGGYSYAILSWPSEVTVNASFPNIGFELDRRGREAAYPAFRQTAGPSVYDAANYRMQNLNKSYRTAPDRLDTLRADFEKTFGGRFAIRAKTGLKYNDDRRSVNTDNDPWTWVGADGVPNSADDSMAPYHAYSYIMNSGQLGPFPFMGIPGWSGGKGDPLDVPAGYWRQTAADAYTGYVNARVADLAFRESVGAAYAMASAGIGALRAQIGIRMEETRTRGQVWSRNATAAWGGNSVGGASLDAAAVASNLGRAERSFVRKVTNTGDYRNFFPSLHLVYEPRSAYLLRASYNRSIARQPVQNLVAGITEGQSADGVPTVSFGNPDLKPHLADNFELSAERYFEPVGLISVGVFLKEISNYSRNFSFAVGPEGIDGQGTFAGYIGTSRSNIGRARIRGIEASYSQQFSFLPGFLKSFGGFVNFTYLQSMGDFGGVTQTTALANKTPRSANAGINFRRRGLDLNLLGNFKGRTFNGADSGLDIYKTQRVGLDLKVQYTIDRTYSVFFNGFNLLAATGRTEVSVNHLHLLATYQGLGFLAGVRGRF